MPFGLLAQMAPTNHVLDSPDDPMGIRFCGKGAPICSIWTFCRELCKNAEPIDSPFGLRTQVGRRKHKAQVQAYSPGGANVHKFNRYRYHFRFRYRYCY